jgi:hypothetical protein
MTNQRSIALQISCVATVFLIPFLFVNYGSADVETARMMSSIFLIGELICYGLWLALFTRSTVYIICLMPLGVAMFRFFLSVLGGLFAGAIGHGDTANMIAALWFGNPLSFITQIAVLIYLLPQFLSFWSPGVLSGTRFESLTRSSTSRQQVGRFGAAARQQEIAPTGGVVHIYNLEDMEKYFEKVAGLEGFAFYTDEWLPYYHNLPQNHATELLGVRLQELKSHFSEVAHECDLEETQRIIMETEHFTIFIGPVSDQFFGLFIFNRNLPLESCSSKLNVMINSVKSYLSTRYV